MAKERCVGSATVGAKGQIVITQVVREMFGIKPGDTVILLADKEKGIAIVKDEFLHELAERSFDGK